MKTHLVIDETLLPEEGNEVFAGSRMECENWVSEQGGFGYKVVPMTIEELRIHNTKDVDDFFD